MRLDGGSRVLIDLGRCHGHLSRLAILGFVVAAGCGKEASAPLRPGASAAVASKAPHLMLILPTTHSLDLGILREVMQSPDNGAGRDYIYREGIVRMGSPASQQGDVIHEAVEKGVSGLLVVAADPDAIAPALTEAQSRGVKVVLLGREVPVEGQPLPLVTFPSPEDAARHVVTTLRKDPGSQQIPPSERALILANVSQDWRFQDCVGTLTAALAGADMPEARVVPFEKTAIAAREALAAALKEDSTIGLVFAEDHLGAEAALQVSNDRDSKFLIGGFVARLDPDQLKTLGDRVVLVDRNVPGLAKQAIKTALQLLDGKTVADRIEVEPTFSRRPEAHESGQP